MSRRAAVIGLGPHGLRMVKALAASNIAVAAVVDLREEVLNASSVPEAAHRCRSVTELVSAGPIDLACIATTAPSHLSLALELLQRGVPRLVIAKPLACSIAECDQVLAAATAAGARVAVDHIRRYSPVYKWLRDRIASGDWGAPRYMWMQRPGIGLGCLGTHSFDAVRFVTGRNVRSVTAWVDAPVGKNPRGTEFVDPGGLVVMALDDGARGVIAQVEDGAGPPSVEIHLTAGRIRLDERSGEIEVWERDRSVVPGPGRPPAYRRAEIPAGATAVVDIHDTLVALFAQILSDEPLESDLVAGRATIEILAAAYHSHNRGNMPIGLPDNSLALRDLWLPIT